MGQLYLISEAPAQPVLPSEQEPPEPPGFRPSRCDECFNLNVFGRTYFINVRIGTEMRSAERRASEGQVRVSGPAFLYCLACSAALMLFGTICLVACTD